jgi:hypothetical protein
MMGNHFRINELERTDVCFTPFLWIMSKRSEQIEKLAKHIKDQAKE